MQSIAGYLAYCTPSYEVWEKIGCLKLEESPNSFHETALCSFLADTSTSSLQIAFELLYQWVL